MTNEIIALMSNQAKYILQCGWQSQEIRRKRLVRAKKIIRVMSRHVLGQILHGKLGKKKLSLIQGWPKSNYLSSWVGPEETVVRPESVKWKEESVFLRELGIVYIVNIVSTLCQYCVNFASVLTTMSKKIQNLEDYEVGVYRVDISTPRTSYPRSISNILLIMMIVVIIMTTTMMMMREQRDVMEVGWSAAHQRPLECISGSRYL